MGRKIQPSLTLCVLYSLKPNECEMGKIKNKNEDNIII
jgi:hypothetical protein